MHYKRWRKHGDPRIRMPAPDRLALFVEKVNIDSDGCWIWTGAQGSVGYGKFKLDRVMDAHRASWRLFRGDIAPGLQVCHSCDVKKCVNPVHLFLGTQQDNMTDKVRKARQTRGETNGGAKLTEAQVRTIRGLHCAGYGNRAIARYFGTTPSNVTLIARRVNWRHVA